MALDPRRSSIQTLSPEARAKVEARLAAWDTPEARADEIRDREVLAEEFRQTGAIVEAESKPEHEFREAMRRAKATLALVRELETFRRSRGLDLETVSERSGIDRAILDRLEHGDADPTMGVVWKYAEAIGARVEWNVVPSVDREDLGTR